MKVNIGLSENHMATSAKMLNNLLADEVVLYAKTRNYHWNVTGHHFASLHKFFEEHYTQLAEMGDAIAERVRQLGHFAVGQLQDMLKMTRLLEDSDGGSDKKMIQNLLDDHETIIRILRNDIDQISGKHNDQGTADFLTGLMEAHEKMAWMLRSHLE